MTKNDLLRELPSVSSVLEDERVKKLNKKYNKAALLNAIRNEIDEIRESIISEIFEELSLSREDVLNKIINGLETDLRRNEYKNLIKVINATGVILHTNLGRAPISKDSAKVTENISTGYSNLEYDIESGERGSRQKNINNLLSELTGAEAGFVVNNNAAAVFLTLNTLCKDKEVVVSRGEQVEIGGSFRIPEIIKESGAKMVEVGTTNKTHLWDYEEAINKDTSCILKVHNSNFRIIGFTQSPTKEELGKLAKEKEILLIEDQGNGNFTYLPEFGLPNEPTPKESIKAGVDLVLFSGDKLLGGPQAGIIVGRKDLIDRIKKNQLARIVRVDKMTLAILENTLRTYIENTQFEKIPVLYMISKPMAKIEEDAKKLYDLIKSKVNKDIIIEIIDTYSQVGGGTLPESDMPDKAISITSPKYSPDEIHKLLRTASTPVISRIVEGKVMLNIRTVFEEDFETVAGTIGELL